VWNVRDHAVAWVRDFDAIVTRVDPDRPDHQLGLWREAFERTTHFGPLRERTVPHGQTLTPAELIDRAGTVSSIVTLPAAEREAVLDEFRALVASHRDLRGRDAIELPYLTTVYWAERR